MKTILLILTLSISFASCGQKKIEEIVTDANGNVISKTEITDSKKTSENISPEQTIEMFYKKQNDVKAIDRLMSFRFYQTTPYVKFKEMLNEKNKACGEFIEKYYIESRKADDNKAIAFTYKVKYKNVETIEEISLLKETENDDYKIFIYKIKRAEK
jgi:hypothetical protein